MSDPCESDFAVIGSSSTKVAPLPNPSLWALNDPQRYAGWLLIEEKAEGGDLLAHVARERPTFLDGYQRICDGAGVALYRRTGSNRQALLKRPAT